MSENVITGSCLCGHIKYEYSGELGPSSYCHCSDCRKETGSAFIVVTRLSKDGFRITTANATKSFSKVADSGNQISRHFCPNCGSPVFSKPTKHPGYIWLRSGTLEDPSIVKPTHQIWTDSKVAWSEIPNDIESFAQTSSVKRD